jgi:cold shock protein
LNIIICKMESVPSTISEAQVQPEAVQVDPVVLQEVKEKEGPGMFIGQTKWFNDKLGYGFVTICNGDDKGKDIFVHHSGIKPLNSNYKTLKKGEYIQFNIIVGMNGLQAVDVTGINAGPLMCDFVTTKRLPVTAAPIAPPPRSLKPPVRDGWQTVPNKKAKFSREGRDQLKALKQQRLGRTTPPPTNP